jgi:hypothetical protein
MFRTFSTKLVNAIINHPDIRPTIQGGDYYLDSREVVEDPDNIVFICSYGVILFLSQGGGVYDGHIAFVKAGRGKVALQAAKRALDDLYAARAVSKVTAAVPLQLRAARLLCRLLGFVAVGQDPKQEFFVLEEK